MYHFEISSNELSDRLLVPYYNVKHSISNLRHRFRMETIGEICSIASGTYVNDYVSEKEGKIFIRVSNIREFICNLNGEDIVHVSPSHPSINSRVILKQDDIVLGRTGTLGKATLARKPIADAIMSQHTTRLRIKSKSIQAGYLTAFLNSEYGKSQVVYSGFGSTRPELTHSALGRVEVPLIEENSQKEISQIVQKAIDLYYESVELLRKAVDIYEEASGVEPSKRPLSFFETSDINDDLWTPQFYRPDYCEETERLEKKFACKRLGQIATVERGKGTRISEYSSSGVPFIRTTDLINYGIDPFPDHYASYITYEEFDQGIKEGDILFSIEGKIGFVALLTSDDLCVFKNHVQRLRVKNSISHEQLFLYLASRSGRSQVARNIVVQATIAGLASRLEDIIVPISPIDKNQLYDQKMQEAMDLIHAALGQRKEAFRQLRIVRTMIVDCLGDR